MQQFKTFADRAKWYIGCLIVSLQREIKTSSCITLGLHFRHNMHVNVITNRTSLYSEERMYRPCVEHSKFIPTKYVHHRK